MTSGGFEKETDFFMVSWGKKRYSKVKYLNQKKIEENKTFWKE